jgi:hypothetical protein
MGFISTVLDSGPWLPDASWNFTKWIFHGDLCIKGVSKTTSSINTKKSH